MKTLAIVQARMGSTRLPGKVMKEITGQPMIDLLLKRLSLAKEIDKIVVAIPEGKNEEVLKNHVISQGYDVFEGSLHNVLERFYRAASVYQPQAVVRITGDCPLIEPEIVDKVINLFYDANVDFACNTYPPTFPDGLDTAVISFSALEKTYLESITDFQKEHVFPYVRESGLFKIENYVSEYDYSNERWSVDEQSDFEVVENVFNHFYPRYDFNWKEVLRLKKDKPILFEGNQQIKRNEGSNIGTGQKLWKRAKSIIPGGNMLLSKRSEMFLPEYWPSYFKKAHGCKVWDLDGNEYIDMFMMGIGTNTLGYSHPEVDQAVTNSAINGNMSSFNCAEEIYLAEKLVELHEWSDMVRFARSGGEATSIAVRIGRAAASKSHIAFCGYHGWHDWYLAANISSKDNLTEHLLPGLDPIGVPETLSELVHPFSYNNYEELVTATEQYDIGVIVMEVKRNLEPENNFLQKVRELATKKNIVLIFDECTTGFRETYGGIHKLYNVEPDIAVFGKALGNGYAITAIVGRREVMDVAQQSFISSTFWTERIGPTAGLKTLDVMENLQSWKVITETGRNIGKIWEGLALKYSLPIKIFGMPAINKFGFNSPHSLAYKTYITQEMLKKGFLAGNCVYVCIEHTQDVLEAYSEAIEPIFKIIEECENGRDISSLLEGPVCHSDFKRLN